MEVLNVDVVNVIDGRLVGIFTVLMVLCFILFLITIHHDYAIVFMYLVLISAGGIFLSLMVCYSPIRQYEVILNDDYSAKELYEKYDVIEQRGEIWVIRDKETETDE